MKKLERVLLREKIMTNIEKDIDASDIAGASVIVSQKGEILLNECRGSSDVERKTELEHSSLFRIASMTKPVTALAALKAEEMGLFSLCDPVKKHFPKFAELMVGKMEDGRAVPAEKQRSEPSLYDLLTHTSGFMCQSPLYLPQSKNIPAYAYESAASMVEWCLENTVLTFPPCEGVGYGAHLPFDMLSVLIEKKTNMTYFDFLKENIFLPLSIKDMTYDPTEEQWGRVVKMCDREKNTPLRNVDMGRHIFENYPLTYNSAGAGLIGSITDYHAFADMLRQGGIYYGKRVVSEKYARKMSTLVVNSDIIGANATTTFGLGVRVILKGYPFLEIGSYGWSGAYGTHFFIDPENEVIGIYMKNTYRYDSLGAGRSGREFERAVTSSLF